MDDIFVYIFSSLLLVLVGIGFYNDLTGSNIKVENSDSCFVKSLGSTNTNGDVRNIYSYCLESVDLDKVTMDDGVVSYSRMVRNLNEDDCLWDGGTCTYYGNNYKIVSCDTGDIVITTLDDNFDYIYEEFCSVSEN